MKPIDFIVSYLKTEASDTERRIVKEILEKMNYVAPALDTQMVFNKMRDVVMRYTDNGERLNAVKHVKDVTGWGLRESKDWVDYHFPQKLN